MRGYQVSVAHAALVAACMAGSAHAQTQASAVDTSAAATVAAGAAAAQSAGKMAQDDGEIVVTTTAQKRFENIQNVPLPVQVLTAEQLKAQGVRNFQDLTKVAPSLVIRPAEHPVNA